MEHDLTKGVVREGQHHSRSLAIDLALSLPDHLFGGKYRQIDGLVVLTQELGGFAVKVFDLVLDTLAHTSSCPFKIVSLLVILGTSGL